MDKPAARPQSFVRGGPGGPRHRSAGPGEQTGAASWEETEDETHAHGRRRRHADVRRRDGAKRRRDDVEVRRQLPDRPAQRHAGLRDQQGRRDAAGRGRHQRRRQAAQPDPELHRRRRRRDHRQPGRYRCHGRHVCRSQHGRHPARLRQPSADQPRRPAREAGVRGVRRDAVRDARDPGGLQADGWQGQHRRDDGRTVEPGRPPAHTGRAGRTRDRRLQGHQDRRAADRQLGANSRAPI